MGNAQHFFVPVGKFVVLHIIDAHPVGRRDDLSLYRIYIFAFQRNDKKAFPQGQYFCCTIRSMVPRFYVITKKSALTKGHF